MRQHTATTTINSMSAALRSTLDTITAETFNSATIYTRNDDAQRLFYASHCDATLRMRAFYFRYAAAHEANKRAR